MKKNIVFMPGDGIGKEIMPAALRVLDAVASKFGHEFIFSEALLGGDAYDKTGTPLPSETVRACEQADAVLLGAVGGEKWQGLPYDKRPEAGLLGIRKALGLYANLRPAVLFPEMRDACPLKDSVSGGGFDIMIVRELTGGIYFGKRGRSENSAFDTEEYSASEIDRICRTAFLTARKRKCRVTSVDKANVLESSIFWRERAEKTAREFPDITLSHMYVDNAAMQLVRDPSAFDVVVTSNMFGDILSDEASMLTGSIGLLPSASVREDSFGMYEPVHGSAPDIAGKGIANPIAQILSAAMMLEYSFGMKEEADAVTAAVKSALSRGCRTRDISENEYISTEEMTQEILKGI